MNKVASFNVDHDKLEKGMYISRIDGDVITYDIRMKKPNMGDYLSNGTVHTLLEGKVSFIQWEPYDDNSTVCRFVTSWATTEADIRELECVLADLTR